jgi:hypothetical protein
MIHHLEDRDPERTDWVEIREARAHVRTRWSVRAAQWRALELAREIFGPTAGARLDGFPPRGPFQGLLHLRVPFSSLAAHRELEGRFLAFAGSDELLQEVPLVFVFEPFEEPASRTSKRHHRAV